MTRILFVDNEANRIVKIIGENAYLSPCEGKQYQSQIRPSTVVF
jgi:hypothetical protein